jgi:DNA-binding protein HU-beta
LSDIFFLQTLDPCGFAVDTRKKLLECQKISVTSRFQFHTHPKEEEMTKAELVEIMADDAGITKVAAAAALDSFTVNVAKALKKKEGKVTLVGFGTFMKVRRKARKGRNPQTGEVIKIKAANVVKFKPGKKLRDAV